MNELQETTDRPPPAMERNAERRFSQRDFRPSPYEPSNWEVVGQRSAISDFIPLELSVFRNELAEPDPMFEEFDAETLKSSAPFSHHPARTYSSPFTESTSAETAVSSRDEAELNARLAEEYRLGVEAGRNEALAELSAAQEQIKEQFLKLSEWVSHEAKETFRRIEKESVRLALQVARKILKTTAEVRPEYIVELLHTACESLGAAKPLRIRVSPQDLEFIHIVGLPPELAQSELGVEYVADEMIHSGCVVETECGEVDLQLETMWEQIKERLYEVLR